MARNECLEAALAELAEAGVRDPIIARGGKHFQIRWAGPGGQERMVTIPCSASDWRAAENARCDVRQTLRADGVLAGPTRVTPGRQPSRIELVERRLAELERWLERLANRL